jgi:iron complex outermembrane receptor protein/vitamin B12 transporter
MSSVNGRLSTASLLRAFGFSTRVAFAILLQVGLFAVLATQARAVVVRGAVTDALGRPVVGARVQLIQAPKPVAIGIAGVDGSYEIRSTESGRFVLLTSAAGFYPGVGQPFYGGATDELMQDVVLETGSVHEEATVTATGVPTPVQQTSSAVTLIAGEELATTVGVVDALRQSPGVDVVQTGQAGGVTSLFVRGGNSDANKVLVDGIPAEDVGGRFDFGTVSSTGMAGLEIYRGPDSVIYGSDAAASVVSLTTPRGIGTKPAVNYSGDAGNFHTYRDEVAVSGTRQKADYYGAFSRFDTGNALPRDEYHSATAAANLGYAIAANTLARFTIRNADSVSGLPNAHDFYGTSAAGKESDQDIFSGLTVENRLESGWHNLVRYGIARKREQSTTFYPAGVFLDDANGGDFYGDQVTIRGANGYKATGQAILSYACYPATATNFSCYPQADYSDSNRDELYYQTDYVFPKHVAALFGFRYENERGSFAFPEYGDNEAIQRTNFEYTLQVSGDIKSRVFYSAGGAVEKNHLYGVAGTPRVGLAYQPVFPSEKWMHGTRLRMNVATGVQEPSLAVDFASLFTQLEQAGDTAAIRAYGITPIRELRTRTYDFGVDQNIRGEKLVLKAGYYHNQFSHQVEYVDTGTLKQSFGISGYIPNFYGADLNSLAFRAQGFEAELDWRPTAKFFVRGGYTYLDAIVEQSFSSDAVAAEGGYASENPNIPGVAIGESPFVGARPFRRPPHSGFFAAEYVGTKFTAAFKGALASRSDDSTYLDYSDLAGTDSMILPNRDLDFGYARLDANFTYAVRKRVTVFSELDNLLGQQHIGPIGYPGLPFTVRAGLKVRLWGD